MMKYKDNDESCIYKFYVSTFVFQIKISLYNES